MLSDLFEELSGDLMMLHMYIDSISFCIAKKLCLANYLSKLFMLALGKEDYQKLRPNYSLTILEVFIIKCA